MSKRFPNTAIALKQYDATEREREELYRKARSNSGVNKWSRRVARDVKAVQRALFNDTSRVNTLENCYHVPISDMRDWVAKDESSPVMVGDKVLLPPVEERGA